MVLGKPRQGGEICDKEQPGEEIFFEFILAGVGLARKKSKFILARAGLARKKSNFSLPGPVLSLQNVQILAKMYKFLTKMYKFLAKMYKFLAKMSLFFAMGRKKSKIFLAGAGLARKFLDF